jgi:pimeloyl-ACP methyl ester carboxylesterase
MRPILVCIHGWGGSKESFTELREALKGQDIEILTPDLPGFGDEPEPDRPWSTDDYAKWTAQWIEERLAHSTSSGQAVSDKRQVYLLGHSHGGRIALKLVTQQSLSTFNFPLSTHLFLCASAGIRHPRHFKRIIGLTLAKLGKFFLMIPGLKALEPLGKKFLYKLVRVHDYENASPVMRETLIKVTAEDLRPLLSKVTVPTDIFWGTDDGMTPVSDGKLMHREIKGSHLHLYPGIRHRVHRDKAQEIAAVILKTLQTEAYTTSRSN